MKIVIYTALIFVVYQLLLWISGAAPGQGRDNFEQNCITAENYRYLKKAPEVLIIGSSKTNFLDYHVLKDNVFHTGFGGQSCLIGLEILSKSKVLPRLICVEVGDTLQWPVEPRYVEVASSPFEIGDVLSCLQHRYQPCALLLGLYLQMFPRQLPPEDFRRYLIEIQQLELSGELDQRRRQKVLDGCVQARALMEELRKRGAKIVMIDPPVEDSIAKSRYVSAVVRVVREYFAKTDFQLLTPPPYDWQTRDGTHLKPESGTHYSIWLQQNIQMLL
ncbi:MAG TPA: hypothetical protein V6C89_08945 [Drouetiella sp.]|jgi:hypothetical protein